MSSIFPLPAPTLPEFDTLLVKGNYHASAPIHLALSYAHAHDAAKVVVLAPSRMHLTADVRKAKDGFLCKNGGNGVVANASRRVEILYPPTPSHLELLLSLFHEAMQDEKDFLHQKTTFSVTPSLIVLCEPSAYLLEARQAT
ncbi:hypothetical protein BC629DRAFT_1298604 [Irpex lacteus]|nr:hypothetical protein BC629DRAFT_1298604 [Irpex lacteus]